MSCVYLGPVCVKIRSVKTELPQEGIIRQFFYVILLRESAHKDKHTNTS